MSSVNAQEVLDAIMAAGQRARERRECNALCIVGGVWLTVHVAANCRGLSSSKIEWKRCEEELPADDTIVQICNPKWVTFPVWVGWRDPKSGEWYDIDGGKLTGRDAPTLWGFMPLAPFDERRPVKGKGKSKRGRRS